MFVVLHVIPLAVRVLASFIPALRTHSPKKPSPPHSAPTTTPAHATYPASRSASITEETPAPRTPESLTLVGSKSASQSLHTDADVLEPDSSKAIQRATIPSSATLAGTPGQLLLSPLHHRPGDAPDHLAGERDSLVPYNRGADRRPIGLPQALLLLGRSIAVRVCPHFLKFSPLHNMEGFLVSCVERCAWLIDFATSKLLAPARFLSVRYQRAVEKLQYIHRHISCVVNEIFGVKVMRALGPNRLAFPITGTIFSVTFAIGEAHTWVIT